MNATPRNPWQLGLDLGLVFGLCMALGVVLVVDLAIGVPTTPMDIVFILDEGGGLGENAGDFKENWLNLADSLTTEGYDCRFAVIPCSEGLDQMPRIPLTADGTAFRGAFSGQPTPAAGPAVWRDGDPLQALEEVLQLQFREGATPIVMLTTNDLFEDQDRLARIAAQYQEKHITSIITAGQTEQVFFRPLYKGGGQFFTLLGEDLTGESGEQSANKSEDVPSLLSNSAIKDTASFKPNVGVFKGIKVKGTLALVCDTSGSMGQDFPPLVKELRDKFPRDTPLILVEGCAFGPGDPQQQPIRFSGTGRRDVYGVDFSNDPHVYVSNNTTDAILMAVRELRRNTVIFNNDLQDGGTQQAIQAFEDLRTRRPFTLSGRSLNRDAPEVLKNFITSSGGEFKVDVISRQMTSATTWGP
jgi:hypothetical protein